MGLHQGLALLETMEDAPSRRWRRAAVPTPHLFIGGRSDAVERLLCGETFTVQRLAAARTPDFWVSGQGWTPWRTAAEGRFEVRAHAVLYQRSVGPFQSRC